MAMATAMAANRSPARTPRGVSKEEQVLEAHHQRRRQSQYSHYPPTAVAARPGRQCYPSRGGQQSGPERDGCAQGEAGLVQEPGEPFEDGVVLLAEIGLVRIPMQQITPPSQIRV